MHKSCVFKWRVPSDASAAFMYNYTELMDFWDWSLEATGNTEMKARSYAVKVVMSTLKFFLSCFLSYIKQTDN